MTPNSEIWARLLLALVFGGAVVAFALQAWRLYRLMRLGRPDAERFGVYAQRLRDELVVYLGQRKLLKRGYVVRGLGHALIFWGFLVITYGTADLLLAGTLGLRMPGVDTAAFMWMVDLFALAVLAAVVVALVRRRFFPPPRMIVQLDGYIILGLIGLLMVTLFLFEAAAVGGKLFAAGAPVPPLASLIAPVFAGPSAPAVFAGSWWLHVLTVSFFLAYLPRSKHLHIVTTLPNVFFRTTRPRGALRKIDDIEQQEHFGASSLRDFTWKQHLDGYTCTECGRCSDNCPATSTGKILDPKMIILKVKEQLLHEGDALLAAGDQRGAAPTDGTITAEELFDCTTCGACVEQCPVTIEHIDKIVDLRRYLVMERGEFPPQAQTALRNLERSGNPWGQAGPSRADWAAGLDVPTLADNPEAEYLYFVGCAASFDGRNQKVARALVRLLRAAKVSFAILGAEETCNGDPARRIGNEYLWQTQAQATIETFGRYRVRKVIASCPHCFNTFKNEYPQLGGSYEVVHASQLVAELIESGRLRLRSDGALKVAYHDPCYLGRHNGVYDAPRAVVTGTPGAELVEIAPHDHERGFCCGAGGGRMWMEERKGERINSRRMEQVLALEAKPDAVASGCPFCLIMLEEAAGTKGVRERLRPLDVLELAAEHLETEKS